VLRCRQRQRTRHRWSWWHPTFDTWLAGRKVGLRGAFYFWFVPTATEGRYRQAGRLVDEEAALWARLPAKLRAQRET
jgi:hypothetical protein